MVRRELIQAVSSRRGITQKAARSVVEAVLACIEDALCSGRRVELRGLGSLKPRHYPGYTGRNPRTAMRVSVGPKVLPVFKPSTVLLRRLNGDDPPGSRP